MSQTRTDNYNSDQLMLNDSSNHEHRHAVMSIVQPRRSGTCLVPPLLANPGRWREGTDPASRGRKRLAATLRQELAA